MEILVSVLIPVCNTEKYVKECVDSVRNQTLKEIEILCLDDGSTDGCPKILDNFAAHDARIRVIHKQNSGYGNTMNMGIRNAKGKYVAFVESDDYIESDMLKDLYEIAEKENCDFVKSNYALFWNEKSERIYEEVYLIPQKGLYQKSLTREEMKLLFRGYIANPTGIYRRDFLLEDQIFHNETPGASYQDLGFFFQVMMKAKRGYLSDKSYYRYRQDNQSSSVVSKEKVFCVCDEYQFIYEKMKANTELFKEYLPVYQMYRFQSCLFNVKRIDSKFRTDFLERVRLDYMKSEKKGELDLSEFYQEEKQELLSIMENPDNYLKKLFRIPFKVQKSVKGYSDLIIYGAGGRGNEVYGWIREKLEEFQFVCYAISDAVLKKTYKNGLEIKCIYDLKTYAESAAVIVAVTDLYKKEIIDTLNQMGFRNIITID